MKKLFSFFTSSGFGLVEVLIAAGMAGGVALMIAKLSQDASRVTKTTESNNEINMMMNDVAYILSDKINCKASISPGGTTPVNNGAISKIVRIQASTSADVYEVGKNYGNNTFSITSMKTIQTGPHSANLAIEITRNNKSALGAKSITKTLPLQIVLNAAGTQIDTCFSDTDSIISAAAQKACQGNSARWDATTSECHHDIFVTPSSACPTGQALRLVTVAAPNTPGTAASFVCEPVNASACPTGQIVNGFSSTGVPQCMSFPCGDGQLMKKTGTDSHVCIDIPVCNGARVLRTTDAGTFECVDTLCEANKYLRGINSTGEKDCRPLPTKTCPTNQYVTQVNGDGSVNCAPVPAATNLAQSDFSFVDGYDAGTDTWSRKSEIQTAQRLCSYFPTFSWSGGQCIPSTVNGFVTKAELAALKPNTTSAIHRSWFQIPWYTESAGTNDLTLGWDGSPELSLCGTETTLHTYTIPSANYYRLVHVSAFLTAGPDDSQADTFAFRLTIDGYTIHATSSRSKDGWNPKTTNLAGYYRVNANTSPVIRILGRNTQGGCGTFFRRIQMTVAEAQ